MKAPWKSPCGPFRAPPVLAPRAEIGFPLSGLGWVPCSQYHPRNTYQETVKHTKPYYWETCRQIINLLGTIKAFSYFWLQMLVTHTYIQTSFFSAFAQFFALLLHPSISLSQNKLPLLCWGIPGRSGNGAGGRERKSGLEAPT